MSPGHCRSARCRGPLSAILRKTCCASATATTELSLTRCEGQTTVTRQRGIAVRQLPPFVERRVRRRREIGCPARQLIQNIGVHHLATPDTLNLTERREHRSGRCQNRDIDRLPSDIEPGVPGD